jgi:hypothetical protein
MTTATNTDTPNDAGHRVETRLSDPPRRVHRGPDPLRAGQVFNLMTDWVDFLPAFITDMVSGSVVMSIVGFIEIAAGIGVWLRPKIFAPVVAAWLGVIIITLILAGGFGDIALRDFGLLIGALALWRLARAHSA